MSVQKLSFRLKCLFLICLVMISSSEIAFASTCNKYLISALVEKDGEKLFLTMNKKTKNQKKIFVPEKYQIKFNEYKGKKIKFNIYFVDGRKDGNPVAFDNIELIRNTYSREEDISLKVESIECNF